MAVSLLNAIVIILFLIGAVTGGGVSETALSIGFVLSTILFGIMLYISDTEIRNFTRFLYSIGIMSTVIFIPLLLLSFDQGDGIISLGLIPFIIISLVVYRKIFTVDNIHEDSKFELTLQFSSISSLLMAPIIALLVVINQSSYYGPAYEQMVVAAFPVSGFIILFALLRIVYYLKRIAIAEGAELDVRVQSEEVL